MGTVISLDRVRRTHITQQARAKGAGVAAAISATRHGFDGERAAGFALTARDLVLAGYSAAMALTKVYARIRTEAARRGPGGRA